QFTALPLTILRFVTDSDSEFKALGAAAILVLLAILVVMNAGAVYLRNRYEQKW
ncbi:MAG: phosphate ABC transporter, permease protein PstA, partial [Thermoleophilaceae bacterium]|nr:phosphate ABC transporter, permease protein PstA [Thermoleophilaceae bacterium]